MGGEEGFDAARAVRLPDVRDSADGREDPDHRDRAALRPEQPAPAGLPDPAPGAVEAADRPGLEAVSPVAHGRDPADLRLLLLVLFLPYESFTNTMRRAFLFVLDVYLPFFAFSRLVASRENLADLMGALCLVAALFAPIAVFESIRGWLLYVGIGDVWGYVNRDAYLMRGDSLRAQAGAGHSLTLGYIFAMAIGCWLYLKATQVSRAQANAFFVVLCTALAFTYARGPWLTGVCVAIAFSALAQGSIVNAVKGGLALVVVMALLSLTPFGAKIIDTLPYIGTQGQDSVAYREQLAEVSWSLIKQNPFFGNPSSCSRWRSFVRGRAASSTWSTASCRSRCSTAWSA
jgi:hypothetical protein